MRDIIPTTSLQVARREIEREAGLITAECAYGMNIFKDFHRPLT